MGGLGGFVFIREIVWRQGPLLGDTPEHSPSELVTFTAAELMVSTTASPERGLALRSPETSPLLVGQDPCGLTAKQTLPLDSGPGC